MRARNSAEGPTLRRARGHDAYLLGLYSAKPAGTECAMHRPRLLVAGLLASLGAAGCAQPPAPRPPESANGPSATSEDRPQGTPASGRSDDAPATPAPDGNAPEAAPTPKHAPPVAGDEIDLSGNDCSVLADTYAAAWLSDALAKESPKKDPKLKELAEKNVKAAAEKARETWLGACNAIVGSAFIRSRLVCASKAKAVARFEACWDGKADE